MANTGQFFQDEELTSQDLQNAVSLLASSFNTLVTNTMYNSAFVIINGLGVSASTTADNGVQVASGLGFQNGQTVLVSTQQGVNILPGSYANGTGLAADSTNPRIDVVYIEYAQTQTNSQTRTFNPPGQTSYSKSVYTELQDGYTLSVVHGTAAASPVAPSAPSGSVVLAQVTVPANATTITSSDITDMTAQYRNDGGRLALATNSLLQYIDSATLGTPSGFTLKVGSTDYIKDNTSTHRMDMQGGTNGINLLSALLLSASGTPLVIQPTTDATSGTHVLSLKDASGAEYGWIDNQGNASFVPSIGTASETTTGTVKIAQNVSGSPFASVRAIEQDSVALSTTSSTTVATFTPSVDGFFSIACHFTVSANTNVGIVVTYANANGATSTTILDTTGYTYTSGSDNDYDTLPVTIKASAGTAINVNFTASVINAVVASANVVGR